MKSQKSVSLFVVFIVRLLSFSDAYRNFIVVESSVLHGPAQSPNQHGSVARPTMAPTSPPVVEPPKQSSVLPGPSPWPADFPKHHGPVAGPALAPSFPSPPKQSSPGPAYSPKHHGPVAGPALAPTYPLPPHVAEPPKPSSASPAYSPKHHAPTYPPPRPPKQSSASPALSPPLPQDSNPTPASDLAPAVAPSKSFATATYSSVMVLAASVLLNMVFSSFVGVF